MEVIAGFLFVILFILVYICLCYIHKILELIQMINDILQIYIGMGRIAARTKPEESDE